MLKSRLKKHMEKKHEWMMFACCEAACSFLSVWRRQVLTHLRVVHRVEPSEGTKALLRKPVSLAMVSCEMRSCEDTVFLGRDVSVLQQKMSRHLGAVHGGLGPGLESSCFLLSCRGCTAQFTLEQDEEWRRHMELCLQEGGQGRGRSVKAET